MEQSIDGEGRVKIGRETLLVKLKNKWLNSFRIGKITQMNKVPLWLPSQYFAGVFAGFGSAVLIASGVHAAGGSILGWPFRIAATWMIVGGIWLSRRDQRRIAKGEIVSEVRGIS